MRNSRIIPLIKSFLIGTMLSVFVLTAGVASAISLSGQITAEAATVKLSSRKKTVTAGTTFSLSLNGASGKVKWSSKNKAIATVDKSGKVTAVAEGKAVIKAKNAGNVYKCKVTVLPSEDIKKQTAEPETPKKTEDNSQVKASAAEEASKKHLADLINNLEDMTVGSTHYELTTDFKAASDSDVAKAFANAIRAYYEFSILFASESLIPTEYQLEKSFPAVESITYKEIKKFVNGYGVHMVVDKGYLRGTDIGVTNIVYGGETSFTTAEEKLIAGELISVAESCKAGTDYQTVRNIHDYIVANTVYTQTYSEDCHAIKGCIIDHRCVCEGYAKAFRLLCEADGIACLFVTGVTDGIDHAWNKVLIDNKWYNVDCTYDDPVPDRGSVVSHSFFCISDDALQAAGHIWDHSDYPVADSDQYDENYTLFQSVEFANNMEEMQQIIDFMLGAGHDSFSFGISDLKLFDYVLSCVKSSPNKPNFNGSIEADADPAGGYGYLVNVSIIRR